MKLVYSPAKNIAVALGCFVWGGVQGYGLLPEDGLPLGGQLSEHDGILGKSALGYELIMLVIAVTILLYGVKALAMAFGGVAAEIRGDSLIVQGRTVDLRNVTGIRIKTVWVRNMIPVRKLVFSIRTAELESGFIKHAISQKRLTVPLAGIAGGRAAITRFCDAANQARQKNGTDEAASAQPPSASFDPEAIIARYLETKASAPPAPTAPPAVRARPVFGTKRA